MNGRDPLAGIRDRFRTRMAQVLAALEQPWGEQSGSLARAEAHKLAGVAATLGYGEVGQAAAKVDALDAIAPDHPAVSALIQALQQALTQEEPS